MRILFLCAPVLFGGFALLAGDTLHLFRKIADAKKVLTTMKAAAHPRRK